MFLLFHLNLGCSSPLPFRVDYCINSLRKLTTVRWTAGARINSEVLVFSVTAKTAQTNDKYYYVWQNVSHGFQFDLPSVCVVRRPPTLCGVCVFGVVTFISQHQNWRQKKNEKKICSAWMRLNYIENVVLFFVRFILLSWFLRRMISEREWN